MGKSTTGRIKKIGSLLPSTMLRAREQLVGRLDRVKRLSLVGKDGKGLHRQLDSIEKRVKASIQEMERRRERRPEITCPEHLPIGAKRDEIVRAIRENKVVIIAGETGSGKSTQIPKMCVEAGRGTYGKIGCTQPRRIAATTLGHRIAEELGEELGLSVGYKIRFRDRTNPGVYIKILTDGMLLAETQADPRLYEYDTLIIDEAHERSLNIDFLLGLLKSLLADREELKLIITSATIDTEKFSAAFEDAPVLEVTGRMYSVGVEYKPLDPRQEEAGEITYVDAAIKAVDKLRVKGGTGDILIFMPTERDILETCEKLEGRHYPGMSILPLFARLSGNEQKRVYAVSGRKIVVATNVAETSLTIPGIRYVIDTGLARVSRYLPGTRTTSLPISPISKSSADQRMGRCGRVEHGHCIRLYSEEDYLSRPTFTPPEIMRSNLAEVILRMISLNLEDIAAFPFVDRPSPRGIKDGLDLLVELGAVEKRGKTVALTEKGLLMAKMPLDPKISRMMIEAEKEDCVREVAIIGAALSIQDPRERPLEKAAQADQMHAPFKNPDSDFVTLLNIWNRYHKTWSRLKSQNRMRRFCKEHYLSFPRMREWVHIHDQITTLIKEQKISLGKKGTREMSESLYTGIHRAILSGFLSNIAVKKEKNIYKGTRGREAMLFPGSTLFNRSSQWIVAAEMVKTSRLFARTAAKIEGEWLESLGGNLCRRSYSDPHWERNRGEVRAYEQVTLFGLVVVSGRPVSYGIIAPEESHTIFVQSALVKGDVREPQPFLKHNLSLVKKIAQLEDKVRRRGILVSEGAMEDFYFRRLQGIYDIKTLTKLIEEKGGDRFLQMTENDLLLSHPDEEELAFYPDQITIGESRFRASYKYMPGKEEDGVTISIPASLSSRIPSERLEWGVPGQLGEKITALIKGLPKSYRKQLVPVSDTVRVIMKEMEREDQSLTSTLARFVYRRFGVDIPASVWSDINIPEHLNVRVSLTDHEGRELKSGRDIPLLGRAEPSAGAKIDSKVWRQARKKWERTEVKTWDFGPLPESVSLSPHLLAYPALEAAGTSVNVRLYHSPDEALTAHKKGVQALFTLHFSKDLKFLKRLLVLPEKGSEGSGYFGGKKTLERVLYERIVKDLFHLNIRTEDEFAAHAQTAKEDILSSGKDLRDGLVQVLFAYHESRSSLSTIEKANRGNMGGLAICSRIRGEMEALLPSDFLQRYPMDRLAHIPRYLSAMRLRAERGAYDPNKDKEKSAQVETFTETIEAMGKDLSPHASPEKQEAVEAFRWLVEEYRVSVFAQELKTQFPVSKKRLEEKKREIERMT